jgi:tetratricopeptide (TPR) repeat protein
MPYVLSTVAENYIINKDYDIALPFLRKATAYAKASSNESALAFLYNDFAEAFIGTKQYDSAFHYIQQAINIYRVRDTKSGLSRSYSFLSQCFEETNKPDSANKYFRLAVVAKDSLFSREKTKLLESMSFTEQLRQKEMESERLKSIEERTHNIQYALIAIGIISFVILFLLLSHSTITNTRVITFLSILALLVVFEFLNLLLHPFLERVTHHSPLLMLLALVCIAALLIPLHHKLEKWTIHKLVEKNKAIRLASAKRTIEQLEEKAIDVNESSTNA